LGVRSVLLERNRAFDFARRGPDVHVDIEPAQSLHECGIEIGHRHRLQRQRLGAAVARLNGKQVPCEVKDHVEAAFAIRHRRRQKPARGDLERRVPPVTDQRRAGDTDFADDLHP
jgi:hypothetical protein